MKHDFCEHLDEYEVAFGRAQASYENCLNLVDNIIEGSEARDLQRTLENSMDEWIVETRKLREMFKKMEGAGAIILTKGPGKAGKVAENPSFAACIVCNYSIPRLEFPEFDLSDEDHPTFRGEALPLPAGAEV